MKVGLAAETVRIGRNGGPTATTKKHNLEDLTYPLRIVNKNPVADLGVCRPFREGPENLDPPLETVAVRSARVMRRRKAPAEYRSRSDQITLLTNAGALYGSGVRQFEGKLRQLGCQGVSEPT